jgi:glycosyltransferase involved in cell wall biosynthesis
MLFDHLLPRFSNHVAKYHPRVIFLADFLNDRQMAALYSLSDFYLSTSHCEGFNAPLLEAMTYGAFPVSTKNTAMRDFVDQDNAIVIDERAFPGLLPRMASDISGTSSTLSVASRFDIARAIRAALEVSRETYDCYVSRNYCLLQERYSGSAIMRLVENRLKALSNKRGGNRDC